ncbi:MAG TPA: rod shape-determining protein MreD [Burkholderiaceae bacterium]|nr:rod shape-determining protein MreD [Burkholderiaceae bacterium]
MTNKHSSPSANGSYVNSSLSSLQPVDDAPFKRPSHLLFVWMTILLTWMLSLLPWRLWAPVPDLLLLVITFWCLHEPRRVNMLTAFVFGLLMDVHDASLLGGQALTYTLVAYGAIILSRRLLRFHPVVQAIHLLPVFVLATGVARIPYVWLAGGGSGWAWLGSAMLTVLLWPLFDLLLLLPQRRLDSADSSSV